MIDDFVGRPASRKRPQAAANTSYKKPAGTDADGFTSEDLSEEFAAVSFDEPKQQPVETAVEQNSEAVEDEAEATPTDNEAPKKRLKLRIPQTTRMRVLSGALVVLLFFGIGFGWVKLHPKAPAVADSKPKTAVQKPKPVPIYSSLSGLEVKDASVNQKSVTGVMIENSVDARPQSGLSNAGVVFEAVAEGGVTRFLALFQDQAPTNIGPVRSARPYYVSWNQGFDAAYAHVGGSPDALASITAWGVKDMNQFSNGGSYRRITQRAAPHNVYAGIDTLNQLETAKGYGASNYAAFSRKADTPYAAPAASSASKTTQTVAKSDARTAASSIKLGLSGPTYDPSYAYDATTNSYKRSEAGAPQLDANTNAQLSPKVVIAIVVPLAQGKLDASGAYYSNYNVLGSGQALVFQDGTVTTATWTKPDNKTNISFTDASGAPLALNRGQTWISAVTGLAKASYQ